MRDMRRMLLPAFVLTALTALPAMPAFADFTVCNKSQLAARVALGRFDGTHWTSQGWWTIAPKTCTRLLNGALQSRYYYLYANDGFGGSWEGRTRFCTGVEKKFLAPGRGDCSLRGLDQHGFFEVDTGKSPDWTQTLSN